jgi:hypothetical protein
MKLKITTLAIAFNLVANAQTPTGIAPNNSAAPNILARSAWYRGGNNLGGTAGGANIFGTMWNSPVYHFTSGLQRMTLFDNTFNNANTTNNTGTPNGGGLAINLNPATPITQPASLLNIGEGMTGGWRPWMKVGTFNSLGSDNMYIGLKNEGTTDRQDAVINWGDNTNKT